MARTITKPLHEDATTALERGLRTLDGAPVIVKTLRAATPTPRQVERLQREHAIASLLDSPYVIKPFALETHGGRVRLIVENFGGRPLTHLLDTPIELGLFLDIAIQLAGALADIHRQGIVHKDIKPANILVHAADPLEWVHCHIARQPPSPREIAPALPEPLGAIVMKLLAKQAEDRYQGARGLQFDLERCREQWQSAGRIEPFPLGQADAATSASVFEADRRQSLLAGCNAFLPKPIRVPQLLELIATQLALTWCYGEQAPISAAIDAAEVEALVPPPPEELAILYELALNGDILGLRARAAELAQGEEALRPFAQRLTRFAGRFEVEQALALIARYRRARVISPMS